LADGDVGRQRSRRPRRRADVVVHRGPACGGVLRTRLSVASREGLTQTFRVRSRIVFKSSTVLFRRAFERPRICWRPSAMWGMYFSMYERFFSSSATRRRWRTNAPRRRPASMRPRRISFTISGYDATASFDSEVNGTHTDAMWTERTAGPVGSAPRDCWRP